MMTLMMAHNRLYLPMSRQQMNLKNLKVMMRKIKKKAHRKEKMIL
jgi:hypothetical protein